MNKFLVYIYRASVLLTVLGMFSVLFFFVSSELSYEEVITGPKLINRFLNEFGAGWIFCVIFVVGFGLILKFKKGPGRFDQSYYHTLLDRVSKRHSGYGILRVALSILASTLLLLYCTFVLHVVTYFGGFATAFLMDRHGQYEAAESWLCILTTCCGSRSDVTVATGGKRGNPFLLKGDDKYVNSQIERLNKCLAELYGDQSIQLAYRFYSLGDCYREAAADSNSAEHYQIAHAYYDRALEIYLVNDSNRPEIAKLYALMASCAVNSGDMASAYENIGLALDSIEKCDDMGARRAVYTDLGHAATILGDKGDAVRYFSLADAASKKIRSEKAPYRYLPQYLMFLLALPYLSIPLRAMVVGSIERNWQEMLSLATDEEDYESLLDDLTIISLYQRKYEQGQRFSTELVGFARDSSL